MSRPGPPPKPTILKILSGNPGKRRLNLDEPRPPKSSGHRPVWLKGVARKTWDILHPLLSGMRVMTMADELALTMLCDVWAEWRAAREIIIRKHATYESATKLGHRIIRVRPEVRIASDASRRLRVMLSDFGLSPAARSRIQVSADYTEDSMAKFLKRGKDARRFFND